MRVTRRFKKVISDEHTTLMLGSGAEDYVVSANVTAYKPTTTLNDEDAVNVDAAEASAASVAALFSRAAGVSVAAAGPVGRAVIELVNAVGGVVRAAAEHHGRHTDVPADEGGGCCDSGGADLVEDVVEVEESGCCSETGG